MFVSILDSARVKRVPSSVGWVHFFLPQETRPDVVKVASGETEERGCLEFYKKKKNI